MSSQNLPCFLEFIKKKWKIGLKIACGNLGYYSLVVWMLRIYPVFLEFTDQMENRGKDGIWELSILLYTCGMNSQNLSRLSRIQWKKSIENRVEDWIWQPRIYSIWRMNSQILPRYSIEFSEKKWEIGVKIAYGNFGYYPQFTSFFSKIHWSNGKLGWRWHMGTCGISYLRAKFSKFTP